MAAGLDRETLVPHIVQLVHGLRPDLKPAVLSPVAGKTGYPPEMLELDLDLQADLGADTEARP
jgi:hypothetical protein